MGLSDIRIFRLIVQVGLTTLSLAVIGLCIKAMNDLEEDKRTIARLLPGGQIEARNIVGSGVALVMVSCGIVLMTILNSIYILKDRCPQAIRKRCPADFSRKTMAVFAFILTPINIAQSCLTATQSARVSSSTLPADTVENLVAFSGRSLLYKDKVTIVDYTVIAWITLLLLLIGITIESSKFSRPEYGDADQEKTSA
ncbi:hypothetical protein PTTG_04322 [Puccinia triticina 1-1 BBBD Race 1]|uniref:Uncharacterized protein n=2 Tax=Puccinia triticina TaxID=208348 RepID=A0A0C4EU43_PUCT1|nr:uncharacterized protein PtA15_1A1005 [Puccinia triticina]OAV94155.1 hypothetical protein PTTG_04322 [Puccinia triticina 1-1 BBBD Race 1]WAQ81663.1 hypothetical protein PtA15_1A1005 [Puccinia triticina]WAR52550.1 hypothetical protein PtB15_1B992 [Puccinia triticina]